MIGKLLKNIFNPLIFEKGLLSFRFYITFMIFLGLFFTKPLIAQHYVNIEGAQVYSTFKFSSEISDKDQIFADNQDYAHTVVSAFGLVYEYNHSSGLFLLGGIGIRKAGASLVFNNIDYIWKLQYVDVKAGIGYQFNKWRIKPYGAVSPYYASLLNANQSMGQKSYDIKAGKFIKKYDLGLFLAIGFKATISKQISIFTEYNYILGLKNIETTADQYHYNRGFAIKLGLSLSINDPEKSVKKIPETPTDLLADKPDPVFITEISTVTIEPPFNPVAKVPSSKNNAPDKEVPAIENKTKKLDLEPSQVNGTPESISNTVVPTKKTSVVEEQSEKEEEVKLVKTNPSNATETNPSTAKNSPKEASKGNSNVSSKNKKEKESDTRNRMPIKILFKLQIASVSKPLGINHSLLKNISGKIEKESGKDGMIRYYSGVFELYEEARSFLSIMKAKGGNEGAFVVAFKNGKQITVYEAKKLIGENE